GSGAKATLPAHGGSRARAALVFAGRFLLGVRCWRLFDPEQGCRLCAYGSVQHVMREEGLSHSPCCLVVDVRRFPLPATPPLRHGQEEQGVGPSCSSFDFFPLESFLEGAHRGLPLTRAVVGDVQCYPRV